MAEPIKTKQVHGFNYWWNVQKQQWEGLINNAIPKPPEPKTKHQWKKYYDDHL